MRERDDEQEWLRRIALVECLERAGDDRLVVVGLEGRRDGPCAEDAPQVVVPGQMLVVGQAPVRDPVEAGGIDVRQRPLALSIAPVRDGRSPLTRAEREGTQSGEAQYARSYTTPPAASRSRFGVSATRLP
jgi:hypothetical protein